ncbi:hypothetical protein Pan97_12080 [Bremerella volcania]|uniref:Uncharacterized protein n=1 Tax=Bremerella volcania TaxID=2527984 RepID=A0A518C4P3_9BACT|nr:hypothetical protein Pan97_12080 [Bremerella volcania]
MDALKAQCRSFREKWSNENEASLMLSMDLSRYPGPLTHGDLNTMQSLAPADRPVGRISFAVRKVVKDYQRGIAISKGTWSVTSRSPMLSVPANDLGLRHLNRLANTV